MKDNAFYIVKNICCGYGKKEIIKDFSFQLEPKTMTAIIGPNGSGKTTLMKALTKRLDYRGNVTLNGEKLEQVKEKLLAQKISYIPQKNGISISLPVIDVVMTGFNPVLKLMERPSKAQRDLAYEALCQVGLGKLANKDFLTLSEGQKQLVLLGRTLIENTDLLILDEPDSALDFRNKHKMMTMLKSLSISENKMCLLSLHDPALALEYCQQIILVKDGVCAGVIWPERDSLSHIEECFRKIYPGAFLAEHMDRKGRRHLFLIMEDE